MITSINNENPYEEVLLKIQSYRDWRYSNNSSGHHFQQFKSGNTKDKNFNYVLCRMMNNQGPWCAAK